MPAPFPATSFQTTRADLHEQPHPGERPVPPRGGPAGSGPLPRRPQTPQTPQTPNSALTQTDLVRQVQTALDTAMERLDVACERFRAVGDAHELRLERLGRALDADRSRQGEQLAALQEGGAQLTRLLETEAARLQDADRAAASRQRSESERLDAALQRLDRLEQRQGRQREALDNASRRLEDLQQALRLEQGTLARHMWALTLALSLTTLLALGGVLLNVLSRGPI
ncbi:MAG TPA: hypothetical protein PLW24_18040 [Burkholderiaceae bacterium]|nr:hypothetical protein [Burkholderiaceae bacterium]